MGIERDGDLIVFEPGPVDVHTHPRAFDVQTLDIYDVENGYEGKAGLEVYTSAMLRSGLTVALAMPNESLRLRMSALPSFHEFYRDGVSKGMSPEQIQRAYESATKSLDTNTDPYPISNQDRLLAFQQRISTESFLPMGNHFGLDPLECLDDNGGLNEDLIERRFTEAKDSVFSLKLYGAETTGGYNLDVDLIPRVAEIWNRVNPDKPIVMHLEDADVGKVLAQLTLAGNKDIPVHIAHVSSRQELQAVIEAKERGQNVTCEVTPHHLYLDSSYRETLGGYGCMKPTLKAQDDIDYIWANIDKVDMFASDCAPHRPSDKLANPPMFGVTNHPVMMSLLIHEAFSPEGRLTPDKLYAMLVDNPRERFNLPQDNSYSKFALVETNAEQLEDFAESRYVDTPFLRAHELGISFPMLGQLVEAQAGESYVRVDVDDDGRAEINELLMPSYEHILVPQIGNIAVRTT